MLQEPQNKVGDVSLEPHPAVALKAAPEISRQRE